jgi:hypothetical protein
MFGKDKKASLNLAMLFMTLTLTLNYEKKSYFL